MRVQLGENACRVQAESGDKPARIFRPGYPADPDSSLLHAVKVELRRQGHDVIKRRLSADGHLAGDDVMQYIRERRWGFLVWDDQWQIRSAVEDYRTQGEVTLAVQR